MKKNRLLIGMMLVTAIVAGTSCENTIKKEAVNIEGIYSGSFSTSPSLKSLNTNPGGKHDGMAEVTMNGDNQIQVHCYGDVIDTTFMLNYFEQNDSVMVCLTGLEFENAYGHMYGAGHMHGGMMGDMSSGETEWMHHLNDEHQEGDEHFGGFNMHDKTFTYSFRMMGSATPYYLKVHGTKD